MYVSAKLFCASQLIYVERGRIFIGWVFQRYMKPPPQKIAEHGFETYRRLRSLEAQPIINYR
jgi:hypothetical protein